MSEVARYILEFSKLCKQLKVKEKQVELNAELGDKAEKEFFDLLARDKKAEAAELEAARLKATSLYECYLDSAIELCRFAVESDLKMEQLKRKMGRA